MCGAVEQRSLEEFALSLERGQLLLRATWVTRSVNASSHCKCSKLQGHSVSQGRGRKLVQPAVGGRGEVPETVRKDLCRGEDRAKGAVRGEAPGNKILKQT